MAHFLQDTGISKPPENWWTEVDLMESGPRCSPALPHPTPAHVVMVTVHLEFPWAGIVHLTNVYWAPLVSHETRWVMGIQEAPVTSRSQWGDGSVLGTCGGMSALTEVHWPLEVWDQGSRSNHLGVVLLPWCPQSDWYFSDCKSWYRVWKIRLLCTKWTHVLCIVALFCQGVIHFCKKFRCTLELDCVHFYTQTRITAWGSHLGALTLLWVPASAVSGLRLPHQMTVISSWTKLNIFALIQFICIV